MFWLLPLSGTCLTLPYIWESLFLAANASKTVLEAKDAFAETESEIAKFQGHIDEGKEKFGDFFEQVNWTVIEQAEE